MNPASKAFIGLGYLLMFGGVTFAEVTAERSERGVVVKIDGQLFTEYLTKAGQAPAIWPVIGPTGARMTRSYPVGPAEKGITETDDHPHHQSVWFTHDNVNGVNYWEANRNDRKAGEGPHIDHREFVEVKSGGQTARIVARNDWMDGNKKICEDERVVVFGTRRGLAHFPESSEENVPVPLSKDGAGAADRWIDFTITLKATDGDVTFGDTKEGTFAVRVADPMRVDAKLGGKIVNSEGQENEAAWGLPARWVDYTGPTTVGVASRAAPESVSGPSRQDGPTQETVGIAIFSHPKSFRPTPRWHVRTYGLFTANPFGEADFPQHDGTKQGPVTIKNGDSLTLRYRILLHQGATDKAALNAAFAEFAEQ